MFSNNLSVSYKFSSNHSSENIAKQNCPIKELDLNSSNNCVRGSFLDSDNINTNNLTINSPSFLVTTEHGTLTPQNAPYSANISNYGEGIPIIDNTSKFTLIETNLTGLDYSFQATGEESTLDDQFIRPAIGTSGVNRADGIATIDSKNVFHGSGSQRLEMLRNTSNDWYSDFVLPRWSDTAIPSLFTHSTTLSGAYQINMSNNLLTSSIGYLSWLRFNFGPGNPLLNVVFNHSSSLQFSSDSGINFDPNTMVIRIELGRNTSFPEIQVVNDQSWFRFQINITQVLWDVFPLGSPHRSSAEQLFTNLSLSYLQLQSFLQEDGYINFWLDDLRWDLSLDQQTKSSWKDSHNLVSNNQSSSFDFNNLESTGLDPSTIIQSNNTHVFSTNNSMYFIFPIVSFYPYISYWDYSKTSIYSYNDLYNKNLVNSSLIKFSRLIGPAFALNQFNFSENDILSIVPSIIIDKLFLFSQPGKEPSLLTTGFDFSFYYSSFQPAGGYSTATILANTDYWNNSFQESTGSQIIPTNDIITLLYRNQYSNYTQWTSTSYQSNTKLYSLYDRQGLGLDSYFLKINSFYEGFLSLFPIINLTITIPNILFQNPSPIFSYTSNGVVIKLNLSPTILWTGITVKTTIYTSQWSDNITSSLNTDGESWIYTPWITTPISGSMFTVTLLIFDINLALGWMLINRVYESSYSQSTDSSSNSFNTSSALTNTSSDLSNSSLNSNSSFNGFSSSNGLIDNKYLALYGFITIIPLSGALLIFRRKHSHKIRELLADD
ncbi:MAG: hypothetical protein ACFFD1_02910 [Candidatus Thorarchaeota archaeon]